MPRLQEENNRIMMAWQEATVETVITLYEKLWLRENNNKRKDIEFYLKEVGVSREAIEYWLNEYKI